jgi:tetratricopeptide (TPR) repeat protein
MTTPFSFDVFLSHNSRDKARVRRLAERLREAGGRIWFDEWVLKPGDDIYLAIERGLEAARTLVLCLSAAALGSEWVGLERSTVLFRDPSNAGRRFIPLLLADCDLPDALRRYKHVDYRQEAEAAFEELLTACGLSTKGLLEDDTHQPRSAGGEDIPPEVKSLLDEGRKLTAEGRYADARLKFESARKTAEGQDCATAVMESRIELAETEIVDQRDVAAARDFLLSCLRELSPEAKAQKRQTVLGLLGDAEIILGSVEEGKSLYREARQLAQKRQDSTAEAHNLSRLSHAEELLGNLRDAHSLQDEATELYRAEHREAKNEAKPRTASDLGACFSMKASLFRRQGNLTEAVACLTRAESLFREANSRDNLGRALVFRAEILFNEAKREDGFETLKEALSTFASIGSVHWQCRCLDDMAKFFFGAGNKGAALACLERALRLIASERPEREAVPYLLISAHLCRDYQQAQEADGFVAQAKAIAARADDDSLKAECLVAEARASEGEDMQAARETLFRSAVKHLEKALAHCEVKGRRAEYMHKIGELYGSLRNIQEARGWFEHAMREHEAIGDVIGMGRCLSSLAAVAREEKSPTEAKANLERLVAFSQGKPLHYHRAGALHDLGVLELTHGNVAEAEGFLDAAKVLAEKHGFEDVLDALKVSLQRLADAKIFYQPSDRDFPSLIQELHDWCARYPKMREAILPLWYYIHRAELWSICRAKLGVKFLICTTESSAFRRTADSLRGHGELFVWGLSATLNTKPLTELIPFPMDFLVPPHLQLVTFKKKPASHAAGAEALKAALRDEAYLLLPFDDTVKGDTKLFVLGRHVRLPQLITKMMLDASAKDLTAGKRICLPLGEGDAVLSIIHILLAAWENRMIPVLPERLPYSEEIRAACDTLIEMPTSAVANGTGSVAKELWTRLLWSCQEDPQTSLGEFSKEMRSLAVAQAGRNRLHTRVYLLRFRAGSQEVVHPAVVAV